MRLPGVEGLVVVEAAEGIAGPFCGQLLADMGARVIKLEPPEGDWARGAGPPFVAGQSPAFLGVNRSKESLVVDLRDARGIGIVKRLAAEADVFLQGYRPGVMERFGLGEAELMAANDQLVYCSVSAYGNRGPKRSRPGTDTVLQAYSGIMSITGEADGGPARVGTPIADTASGTYAALAVVAMLLRRSQTGRGGSCDTSLLEAMIHLQTITFAGYFGGEQPRRLGSRSSLAAVPAEAFATADGYITMSCHGSRQWRRLTAAIGHPEWATDPGTASNAERLADYEGVIGRLGDVIRTRTTAEWMEVFERDGVNAGVVREIGDVAADEQVRALGLVHEHESQTYGALPMIGFPFGVDGASEPLEARDPPLPGEHTRAILAELGVDDAETLLREGVVLEPAADRA